MSSVIYSNKFVELDEDGQITVLRSVKNMEVINEVWTDSAGNRHSFRVMANGSWSKGDRGPAREVPGVSWVELGRLLEGL